MASAFFARIICRRRKARQARAAFASAYLGRALESAEQPRILKLKFDLNLKGLCVLNLVFFLKEIAENENEKRSNEVNDPF